MTHTKEPLDFEEWYKANRVLVSIMQPYGAALAGWKAARQSVAHEIKELEQQRDRFSKEADGLSREVLELSTELGEVKAKRDELLAALKKYGVHTGKCASQPIFFGHPKGVCDCGLDEAITKAGGAQ